MRADLHDKQWDQVHEGWLLGPDERGHSRQTTRTKRKDAERLVEEGAPLVLFYWAGQQLDWFDGAEARQQWHEVRARVVSTEPQPKADTEWTAGRSEDEDGRPLLFLTGHC